MQDYTETLLSQYANSPAIASLIESFNDAIDPAIDIQAFYSNIWNINTAVGYGLDVWGQIVGVSRNLEVTGPQLYFGFAEAFSSTPGSVNPQPFNSAPFYAGPPATQIYTLGDQQYRTLIIAKAMTNVSPLTAKSINRLIAYIFQSSGGASGDILGVGTIPFRLYNPAQRIYVQDNGAMQYTVIFESVAPSAVQLAIILNSGVFPRPVGVSLSVVTA